MFRPQTAIGSLRAFFIQACSFEQNKEVFFIEVVPWIYVFALTERTMRLFCEGFLLLVMIKIIKI